MVAVLTAPRKTPTIENCLENLAAAGWPSTETHVFAEPNSSQHVPSYVWKLHRRPQQLGCWPNFFTAAWELLCLRPQAQYFMFVEDDGMMYCGLNPTTRDYLTELCRTQFDRWAMLSLYSSGNFPSREPTVYETNHGWCYTSTVAIIFSRESLEAFLTDRRVLRHRFEESNWHGTRLNDAVIGRWAAEDYKKPIAVHVPILVQHLDAESTLGNPPGRTSQHFLGDEEEHAMLWQSVVARMTPTLRI